jgi:hypothetical protein
MSCAWTDVAIEAPASAAKAIASFFIVLSVFGLTFVQSMDVRRATRWCPRPDGIERVEDVGAGTMPAAGGMTCDMTCGMTMVPATARGPVTPPDNASFPIAFPVAECATLLP